MVLAHINKKLVWNYFSVCRTISVSTQVQGGDFNLYEGARCHGVPLVTISRGRLVCENGVFMCAEGSGKFYPQRMFPDYLYKKMVQREKVWQICVLKKCEEVLTGHNGSCCSLLCQLTVNWLQAHHAASNCSAVTDCIKALMLSPDQSQLKYNLYSCKLSKHWG